MNVGTFLIPLVVLIIAIWLITGIKRIKHKVVAIFLVVLVLFFYLGVSSSFQGEDIDFKTAEGWEKGISLFWGWIQNSFSNIKTLTGQAINMDWKSNETGS